MGEGKKQSAAINHMNILIKTTFIGCNLSRSLALLVCPPPDNLANVIHFIASPKPHSVHLTSRFEICANETNELAIPDSKFAIYETGRITSLIWWLYAVADPYAYFRSFAKLLYLEKK